MNNQQDVLSKSYTDSISSELYKRMAEDDSSIKGYNHSQSVHSNMSSYTNPMYTKSLTDYRRGSAVTLGDSSSYYDPIREDNEEEESLYSQESQDIADKVTPLPKVQMFVIAIILFSEPLTSTILFPFIYYMVT